MASSAQQQHQRGPDQDGATEQIVGDPEANKFLSRPYRGEWVYPTV